MCAAYTAFIINLKRRPERLKHIKSTLPKEISATYTTDWTGTTSWKNHFDGRDLKPTDLETVGFFPWQIESEERWWRRPMKMGEVGCAMAHWEIWNRFKYLPDDFVFVFEDDALFKDNFIARFEKGLSTLSSADVDWDLIYLGRSAHEDEKPFNDQLVYPGYSYGAFAYALHKRALPYLLSTLYDQSLIPVDELLPAMFMNHPRQDVRARYPRQLNAFAFKPSICGVREVISDTEGSCFIDGSLLPPQPLVD